MTSTNNTTPQCIACSRTSQEAPLLSFLYCDQSLWICSTHLPILIHHPEQLEGRLAGASGIEPGEDD